MVCAHQTIWHVDWVDLSLGIKALLRDLLQPIHPESLLNTFWNLYAELFYFEEVSFARIYRVLSQAIAVI